jgi:hypothetical protein
VNESNKPHMDELREHLMATLASLRDRESPMDVDRARAVAQVAGVLVETAKVEVEFIKATNGDSSSFIGQGQGQGQERLPAPDSGYTQGSVTREPGRTVHKLRG